MQRVISEKIIIEIIENIKSVNTEQFHPSKILLQGESRRILPALAKVSEKIPNTIFVLRQFRDNPHKVISREIIEKSLLELSGQTRQIYRSAQPISNSIIRKSTLGMGVEQNSHKPAQVASKTTTSELKNNRIYSTVQLPSASKPDLAFTTTSTTSTPTPLLFKDKKQELTYRFIPAQKQSNHNGTFKDTIIKENLDVNTYKIFLDFTSGENFDSSIQSISNWLTKKKGAPVNLFEENTYRDFTDETNLSVMISHAKDSDYKKILILEETEFLEFHTEILISFGENQWIWVQSESTQEFVAMPPTFIKEILPLSSNRVKETEFTLVLNSEDIDLMVGNLLDDYRTTPVFIASTDFDNYKFEKLSGSLSKWHQTMVGIGEIFLLSPEATAEFNKNYPYDGYMLTPWSVRVFRPGLDFEDYKESKKHRNIGEKRVLSRAKFKENRILIARIARSIFNTWSLPEYVNIAKNEFAIKANRELLYGTQEESAGIIEARKKSQNDHNISDSLPFPHIQSLEILEAVKESSEILDVENINSEFIFDMAEALYDISKFKARRQKIEDKLQEQQQNISLLTEEKEFQVDLTEDVQIQLEESKDEVFRLTKQVQYLQNKLIKIGKAEDAFQFETSIDDTPENFVDLIERLTQHNLSHVVFTGDKKIAYSLDEIDTKSTAVRNVWQALFCLNDYGRYKIDRGSGSLYQYLKNTPQGFFNYGVNNYRASESDTTMQQFGYQRVFTVPKSDESPDGSIEMKSHFRIKSTDFGTKEPRLHLSDFTDIDGRIYVGYIGPHLDTKSTN